jgi:hypothetical protein
MRSLALLLLLWSNAFAAMTDVKFGRYQIADSQWNVSACLYTTTCQIYSKNPGTAYKIPWTSGQVQWATGDYVKFDLSGNGSFPYTAKQYDSAGNVKSTLGNGKIVNMGPDYFFFVGSDNNTGQLFSGSSGMSNTSGVTWTGTLNPTIAQADNYATTNYSTTPLAPGQTAAPALCCGGSAASFNANPTNTAKIQTFINRTTADSQVYIEQIGNQNTITVNQSGTRNNYVKYTGNGSSNEVAVIQQGNSSTQVNYIDLQITGDSNTVNLQQLSTGGGKGIFADVGGNSNNLTVQQKDSGSHLAEINLSGGNKTVNVLQQGSASHMSNITLSGTATGLTLTQSGSSQQFYSIQHNCSTAGGCAAITVTQGQ